LIRLATPAMTMESMMMIYYLKGGSNNLIFLDINVDKDNSQSLIVNRIDYFVKKQQKPFVYIVNINFHWEPIEEGKENILIFTDPKLSFPVNLNINKIYEDHFIDFNELYNLANKSNYQNVDGLISIINVLLNDEEMLNNEQLFLIELGNLHLMEEMHFNVFSKYIQKNNYIKFKNKIPLLYEEELKKEEEEEIRREENIKKLTEELELEKVLGKPTLEIEPKIINEPSEKNKFIWNEI